jgi:hypothetical protein
LFLGVPQKVRERRAPGGGVCPEAEPREGGQKEETTKWTENRSKSLGAFGGAGDVGIDRTVARAVDSSGLGSGGNGKAPHRRDGSGAAWGLKVKEFESLRNAGRL